MIGINYKKFNDLFRTSKDLPTLLGSVCEPFSLQLEVYYEKIITSESTVREIYYEPTIFQTGLSDNTGIWYSEDGFSLAGFKVGDKLGVKIGSTYYYSDIIEVINDGLIRIAPTSYAPFGSHTNWYMFDATPIEAVKYKFNLTDSVNFNSLVDGELSMLVGDTTSSQMLYNGQKGYQYQPTAQTFIKASSSAPEKQIFQLTLNHVIAPFFLSDQYNDIIAGVKPSYFSAGTCLNYISEISLYKSITDTDAVGTKQIIDTSNTGWFNERLNGLPTNYSINSLSILNGVTSVGELDLNDECKVTVIIENTTDSPFTTASKLLFGFNYLPEDSSLYVNNGEYLADNFAYDIQIAKDTDGTVNGNNYGTSKQAIKDITITRLSATQLQAEVHIKFGSDIVTLLKQGSFKRYMMYCMVDDVTLPANTTDKVNLLLQVNEVNETLTTTNLINPVLNGFLQHPFELDADVITGDLDVFPVDDVVHNLDFSIDFTSHLSDGILIKNVKPKLVLRKTGQADIILEDFSFNVANYPLIGGLVQNIAYSKDKVYKIPASIRKSIQLNRVPASDVGNTYFWKLTYPFFIRWEYWRQLLTTFYPSDLFDNSLNFNGFNHNWYRLNSITGYEIYYEVEFDIEQNGVDFSQKLTSSKLIIHDFLSNTADFASQKIESFDTSNNLLTYSGTKYLLGYEDVKVVASFEPNDITGYTVNDFEIVIEIETYENGGINDIRQISSVYQLDSNSWFKSTDSSNKVVKSMDSTYLIGEAYLDYTKIPNNINGFNIYARLYDKTSGSVITGKQFMTGISFEFMTGLTYKFMNQ